MHGRVRKTICWLRIVRGISALPVNRSAERTLLPGCHRFIEIVKISMLHIFTSRFTTPSLPPSLPRDIFFTVRNFAYTRFPLPPRDPEKSFFLSFERSRVEERKREGDDRAIAQLCPLLPPPPPPVKREREKGGGILLSQYHSQRRQGNNYQDRVTPNLKILLRSSSSILSLQRQTSTAGGSSSSFSTTLRYPFAIICHSLRNSIDPCIRSIPFLRVKFFSQSSSSSSSNSKLRYCIIRS